MSPDEALVDFGPAHGLWEYANGATWGQLHTLRAMVGGRFH
jgi:hypothetical protein